MGEEHFYLLTDICIIIKVNDYLAISLNNTDLQGLHVFLFYGNDLGKSNFSTDQTFGLLQVEWVSPSMFIAM